MSKVYCFAFVYDEDGMIDIETIDATPEKVKHRLLEDSLEVRREELWKQFQAHGKIVRVVIEPAEGGAEHGN